MDGGCRFQNSHTRVHVTFWFARFHELLHYVHLSDPLFRSVYGNGAGERGGHDPVYACHTCTCLVRTIPGHIMRARSPFGIVESRTQQAYREC